MSRPIKFRVWRDAFTWTHLGTHEPAGWLPDRYIGVLGSCYLGHDDWGDDQVYYDRGTEEMGGKIHIEQFTGLLDHAGREIYEGDILRVVSRQARPNARYFQGEHWMEDGSDPVESVTRTLRAEWSQVDGMWRGVYLDWVRTNSGDQDGQPVTGILASCFICAEVSIIGNIHQSPELLKP